MITVNYYSTVENNLALSNKTEAVIPQDSIILPLNMHMYSQRNIQEYYEELFIITTTTKNLETTKKSPSSVEWMTKLWNSHRLKQYSVKMNEFLPCAMTGY